jgi:hypothetical protein
MREYDAGQVRDAANVREVRVRGLQMEIDGRDSHADLHARSALCHENQSADEDDNGGNHRSSAQLERVPRMDDTTQADATVQASDAETVANTLETSAALRRKKRKLLLDKIAEFQKEIAVLDHTIKVMEQAGRKLRHGQT